jgi:hypothetical protein
MNGLTAKTPIEATTKMASVRVLDRGGADSPGGARAIVV